MGVEEVMRTVLDEFKTIASTDTIIGKAIEAGNSTIIPVSKVSLGFAGGGGTDKTKGGGSGSGGGATIEPVAFIVVTDGKVSIQKIKNMELGIGDILDKVPPIVSKLWKKKESDGKKPEKEEKKEEA